MKFWREANLRFDCEETSENLGRNVKPGSSKDFEKSLEAKGPFHFYQWTIKKRQVRHWIWSEGVKKYAEVAVVPRTQVK